MDFFGPLADKNRVRNSESQKPQSNRRHPLPAKGLAKFNLNRRALACSVLHLYCINSCRAIVLLFNRPFVVGRQRKIQEDSPVFSASCSVSFIVTVGCSVFFRVIKAIYFRRPFTPVNVCYIRQERHCARRLRMTRGHVHVVDEHSREKLQARRKPRPRENRQNARLTR